MDLSLNSRTRDLSLVTVQSRIEVVDVVKVEPVFWGMVTDSELKKETYSEIFYVIENTPNLVY